MKKRILVFTTYFYPHLGGYEKNVEELFSHISRRGNYEVDIVCFNTENVANFEIKHNLHIYRIDCWNILKGTYALPKWRSWKKIRKDLNEKEYSTVSTQTRFFFSSLMGLLYAKKRGAKIVHTERGTTFVKQGNLCVRIIAYVIDQTIGRLIVSSADIVTGVSEKACDFTKKLGSKNPVKIFNGIDTGFWKKNETSNKNPKKIVVSFVGRIIEAKGVQDLLKSVQKLSDHDELEINIVGNGNYLENIKKLAKKLGLKNVNFFGKKSHSEIIDILSETDIFVNPSYTEGLPTSVIEAGACECAVIASDVGGTNEIIDDGINGYIFKPKDIAKLTELLEDLMENRVKREEFGKKLSQKVKEKFNWENIVDQYLLLTEK